MGFDGVDGGFQFRFLGGVVVVEVVVRRRRRGGGRQHGVMVV